MKLIFAVTFLSISTLFTSNKELADLYINSYKDIAVSEMHRTGIPASIKLAQGLLESDWGRSDLAMEANNHFGIKCGNAWNGQSFYKEDDDRDKKGRLIESCFRAFPSVQESYMAHSDFLTDPNKQYRYGFLFKYKSTDYKSWAKGLRKAGYATDPNYPKKLIMIIEKYELYKYDLSEDTLAKTSVRKRDASSDTRSKKFSTRNTSRGKNARYEDNKKTIAKHHTTRLKYGLESINECKVVIAKGGETVEDLAKSVGVSVSDLLRNNEMYYQADQPLDEGAEIYLEKKKRSFSGLQEYHLVQEGETMASIAQKYGIRLRSLYSKNRMPNDSETYPGVKLSIKKTVSLSKRPKYITPENVDDSEFLFSNDDTIR